VFHNEKPASVPFPEWIDPAWHNCLVGCLLCQHACPENRDNRACITEAAVFSGEETELLLAGTSFDLFPAPMTEKIKACDLQESLDIMPRNLRVLMGRGV
jgi:epoxyqueuosine reductase